MEPSWATDRGEYPSYASSCIITRLSSQHSHYHLQYHCRKRQQRAFSQSGCLPLPLALSKMISSGVSSYVLLFLHQSPKCPLFVPRMPYWHICLTCDIWFRLWNMNATRPMHSVFFPLLLFYILQQWQSSLLSVVYISVKQYEGISALF